MSRGTIVVCALIVASTSACGIENELQYTSTLEARTNGLALSEDGLDGTAGMVGMTCTIDAMFGCPTVDIDLPTEDEYVEDHFLGRTLGRSELGLHTIDELGYDASLDVAGTDVRTARYSYDGPMWLAGTPERCQLHLPDGKVVEAAHGSACRDDARVTVDRAGALIVSARGVTQRLDADGGTVLAKAGDLVSWDESLELLYTANRGGEELWAIDRAGDERWRAKVRKPVRDLTARGLRGEVLVRLDHRDTTLVERRDGRDGSLLGRSELGDAKGDMVVSENGRTVGFVQTERVSFFRLATDPEDDEVTDPTPPDCLDAGSRVSSD